MVSFVQPFCRDRRDDQDTYFFVCPNPTPDAKDMKFESFQISEFFVRPSYTSSTDLSDNVYQLSKFQQFSLAVYN
jgi:hypothetical protein